MIAWLNPAALAALAVVAIPVVVHLLLRRRARRIPFPTLQFLRPSDESAVRVRVPSDLWLLLVRMAIVACAALAVARPLVVNDARREAWAQRTVRAIVVDTSRSINGALAAEAATAESAGAEARRFEGDDLAGPVRRAARWLADRPPARRELVVLSDFQRGSSIWPELKSVPADIGVRLVPIAGVDLPRTFEGEALLKGTTTAIPVVDAGVDGTAVTFREGEPAPIAIEAPPDIARRLAAAVADAGALAPAPGQPAVVLPAGVRPDSLEAAAFVQSSLNARRNARDWAEREPERLQASDVESGNRAPAPPSPDAWTRTDDSDGRWLWLLALVLLGVEWRLRTVTAPREREVEAHAA